jgi:thiamine pyrophosphate-dependent acetolactate synthase large subunit-like protein
MRALKVDTVSGLDQAMKEAMATTGPLLIEVLL